MKFVGIFSIFILAGCCQQTPEPEMRTEQVASSDAMIYGQDDRKLWRENPSSQKNLAKAAQATGALVIPDPWRKNLPLKDSYILCDGEAFLEEIAWSQCSGVLVGKDLFLTAGHCVKRKEDCANLEIYFGFERTPEAADGPYKCKEIIAQKDDAPRGGDYALLKLDRSPQRNPLELASEPPSQKSNLWSFSHPLGLPLMYAPAKWKTSAGQSYFRVEVDTFEGSSGSPLINEKGQVAGILSSGGEDIDEDELHEARRTNSCVRFRTCDDGICPGETFYWPGSLQNLIPVK